jgi:phosphatidylglycerophosphatase C
MWNARLRMTRDEQAPVNPPPAGVALYDLDGTLLAWDCQLLFRHHVLRREPWRGLLLPVFLAAVPLAGWLGTARMKRVFLSYLWKMPPARLAWHSREFARSLLPAIYPELRDTLARHREDGRLLILASASPEIYVREIGRELGFDLALGTPVTFGPLFPPLENHKGAAKVRRLFDTLAAAAFTPEGKIRRCHGYTDSRADLPMLGLCDEVTVVNPDRAMTALAGRSGWRILRPARPWRSRLGFALRILALLLGLPGDPANLRGTLHSSIPKKSRITSR